MSWVRRTTWERRSVEYSANSGRWPNSFSKASTVAEMLKRVAHLVRDRANATSDPMASSVRARRSWACMFVYSVTSRKVRTHHGGSPPALNHGLPRR
jgi:hypothetical protein